MLFFQNMRNEKMRPKLQKEFKFYNKIDESKIDTYQLDAFNKIWGGIQENVPYYNRLASKGLITEEVTSWNEFLKLPIINREYAKDNIRDFTDMSREIDSWVTTGGSTGTPLKYPSWKEESPYYEPSLWFARDFYKINRADRMYRIWGHSHTLGKGLSRFKKMIAFKIGHPLIGYKRFSAYDLSEEKLKVAGNEIIKFKPNYIIGYSKALMLLARANSDKKGCFHKLNLKAVIGAAEGFDNEEDKEFISDIFGAPVGLEYASMETKLLAHTHPNGEYKVIWRNNLVECVDENGNPAKEGRILVTSLYPRAFPLIRYELGDIITGVTVSGNSVYEFKEVKGRDNDFLMLDENTPIHSEGITHAIKISDTISAYQIRYTEDMIYTIYLKANKKLAEQDFDQIRNRLGQVDKRLKSLKIKQTEQLKQTVAGKIKWLIEE